GERTEGMKGGGFGLFWGPPAGANTAGLRAFKTEDPIAPLSPPATPAHCDAPRIVAAALASQAFGQGLDRLSFPQLAAIDDDELTARRCRRIEGLQCHRIRSPSSHRCADPREGSRSLSCSRSAARDGPENA